MISHDLTLTVTFNSLDKNDKSNRTKPTSTYPSSPTVITVGQVTFGGEDPLGLLSLLLPLLLLPPPPRLALNALFCFFGPEFPPLVLSSSFPVLSFTPVPVSSLTSSFRSEEPTTGYESRTSPLSSALEEEEEVPVLRLEVDGAL